MKQALYVHVPFCDHICAYCDFVRCGYHERLADQWLLAIEKELADKQPYEAPSIYIGGGTPSALSLKQLEKLLAYIKPYATQVSEYTIEANADSFTQDKIALCKAYGMNRVSLGAQSFSSRLLKRMGRIADETMVRTCIKQLRQAGIDNISLDLMYGLPEQSMDDWVKDLEKACTMDIMHLSLYALTIEEHSRFGREQVLPCDPESEADFYEKAIQVCEAHQLEHYEISSFAKDAHYSMHNLAYWHYDDFVGIGCGASGKQDHQRYDNTRNLHTYIQHGPSPDIIALSKTDEMFEMMMMGLRIKNGVDDYLFRQRYACSYHDVFEAAIQKHLALHHLKEENHHLRTTKQGMMVLHDILVDFL